MLDVSYSNRNMKRIKKSWKRLFWVLFEPRWMDIGPCCGNKDRRRRKPPPKVVFIVGLDSIFELPSMCFCSFIWGEEEQCCWPSFDEDKNELQLQLSLSFLAGALVSRSTCDLPVHCGGSQHYGSPVSNKNICWRHEDCLEKRKFWKTLEFV